MALVGVHTVAVVPDQRAFEFINVAVVHYASALARSSVHPDRSTFPIPHRRNFTETIP